MASSAFTPKAGPPLADRGIWAASTAYVTGDIVTYGSSRFVRTGAGFTSGATFDPSNWVALDRLDVDNPVGWGTALSYSEEFDATSSSLPSGFGWVNQGSATYDEKYGAGKILAPSTANINWRALTKSLSGAPSAWLASARLDLATRAPSTPSDASFGLVLRESSSGKLLTLYNYSSGAGVAYIYLVRWASPTDSSPSVVAGPITLAPHAAPRFLRIRKNSSTSYDFEISFDGVAWHSITAAHNPTASMTPDEIGFGGYVGTQAWEASCHWLRVR